MEVLRMAHEAAFDDTVDAIQRAGSTFLSGDAEPAKNFWSRADDVTIFGGWGAYELGWAQVGPRLEWAATRFAGGSLVYEALTSGSSVDLGYTIGLERSQVRLVGTEDMRPMLLRATAIYRREGGAWKVIHRHADPVTEKTAAETVLQH
jgi:ketosteroid isomerase-like protein